MLTSDTVGTLNDVPVTLGGVSFQGFLDEVSITVGLLSEKELQSIPETSLPEPFRVTRVNLDPSDSAKIEVTFESDETRFYTVQKSSSLAPKTWTDIATLIPGEEREEETTVKNIARDADSPTEFFRVSTKD